MLVRLESGVGVGIGEGARTGRAKNAAVLEGEGRCAGGEAATGAAKKAAVFENGAVGCGAGIVGVVDAEGGPKAEKEA